jgi:hypothetical protein
MKVRTLKELLDTPEPAWPLVQDWVREATNVVEILPASQPACGEALVELQVTARSPMGAVIYETGGLLIDHGWLRMLGSGHPRLPRTLPGWNRGRSWHDLNEAPPFLLIADDVVGGFFALNGGRFGKDAGIVYYFAPDNLTWETTDLGYTAFVQWCLSGNLALFYKASRWSGWEVEAGRVSGEQAFSIAPPLWAAGPPVGDRSRRPVPVAEVYDLQVNQFAVQIRDNQAERGC